MHSQGDRALRQLWGIDPPAAKGPKARWSLAQVAEAAVELADEVGLDAISLARVAARLDMTTTALYRYVDAKATLIDLMVDSAVGDPPAIEGDGWQNRCRAWTELLADRYAQHPWLSEVQPTGMPTQPRAYAWIDALLNAIADDAPVDALRLAMLLDSLIRTYATLERSTNGAAPPAWLGEAVAERFPRLAGAEQQDVTDVRAELRYAVEAVLRGAA
ncbi:TetR/AcrR family transcriptional regulator [Microbacterium sp. KUDC0406]|uniref:TetR/AcrR family transcriptional regulator n=1 Tax=Microbacterium sp. KUDC0406 TaxID=2909588 RepID=UPI001F2FFE5F|nr:TetR family transcriptional regulator [Microbacterium sp. KUDC0406]UJP09349.1 TetR/AcrR family transcriptional regulator [Microbacterium sp. KUDC0406]